MNRVLALGFVAALGLLVGVGSARAVLIEVVPSSQGARVGDSVDVEIRVSNLGHLAAPSLSSYDLDLGFDPTVLALTGVTLDQGVNDGLDLSGLGHLFGDTPGKGTVNLWEQSSDKGLDTLQPGRFTLAELTFEALAVGESPLTLTLNALEDASGAGMKCELSNGSVKVGKVGPVPEPASMVLFLVGAGIVGIALRRRLGSGG